MSIYKELKQELKKILKNAGYEVETLSLETSNRRDLGEYQLNDAMQLARTYKQNPREIAAKIVAELEKDDRFTNINIAGPGFINISLSEKYAKEILNRINEDVFNNIDKKDYKKVVIDYGGANVAKALHVGHLRSANIGEALKRLALLLGYDALGDAHLGDYGRPLGLVLREIKARYPDLEYFDENYEGDFSEVELPITNADLEIIYPYASNKSKEDEQYLEEAREITLRIQKHEKGYYDLWKRVVDISKEDIKKLKVVAKELLEKIKAQLATMDHPFDKQETRASIIITIRDILWKELPESYTDESINYYRDAVYNYVSQHYGSVA